jgi:uncharacterized protein
MKLLFWLVIIVAVVVWLLYNKKQSVGGAPSAATKPGDKGKDKDAEVMLQCAHCGVHIPASESIVAPSGAVFCSEEHRLQHARS